MTNKIVNNELLKTDDQSIKNDDNSVILSLDNQTNEQSRKSMIYIGLATAIGGALLFGFVYMKR